MELRRLHYFAVLARHLHFGRAAAEIGIAQPGLSQQIKVLEKELRVQLFDRGRGGVRLTPAGLVLAREAPEMLDRCDALVQMVRDAARDTAGVLRVAYTRSGADLRVGELVRAFHAAHPEVEIEALTGWTSWNLELLQKRTVDVAFVRGPVIIDGLEVLDIGSSELAVALPDHHRLAGHAEITPAELAAEPVVLWPRHLGPAFYDRIVDQVWPAAGPRIVQEEPESEQILAAVAAGAGLSVLDRTRAVKLCPPGAVVRPFAGVPPLVSVALAWRRDDAAVPIRRFVSFTRARRPLTGVARHRPPPRPDAAPTRPTH
ncbi:MAG TPA: LysR family transcriptional regulator [Pseudonocardiaceae bacterium]|nr:LysR family transcriptional regulator [Pseudonocardiaceae bacterium]